MYSLLSISLSYGSGTGLVADGGVTFVSSVSLSPDM